MKTQNLYDCVFCYQRYEKNKCYYKCTNVMVYLNYLLYQTNLLLRERNLLMLSAVVEFLFCFEVCVNWINASATSSSICIDINMCVFYDLIIADDNWKIKIYKNIINIYTTLTFIVCTICWFFIRFFIGLYIIVIV